MIIYFDNAATTFPKPDTVPAEICNCIRAYGGNPGRSAHSLSVAAAEKVFECRADIAAFFGNDKPENVVFTNNTTTALNLAIKAVARRSGHILISNIEHNSVYRPVCALGRNGIEYSLFNALAPEEVMLREIERKLRRDTTALVCLHASNVCGIRLPIDKIGEICRRRTVYFILDAAQSTGVLDIDMHRDQIDILCAPGHKGLYGPQGSGFALFSDRFSEADIERFSPLTEGGNGVNSMETSMPSFLPERMEAGTLSTPCIAGLWAGLQFVKNTGMERIRENENRLYCRSLEMLQELPQITVYASDRHEGNTLLFNAEGIPANEVASALDRDGICVRSGLHCSPMAHRTLKTGPHGAVRISFGAFNTMEELDIFYRRLKALLFTY